MSSYANYDCVIVAICTLHKSWSLFPMIAHEVSIVACLFQCTRLAKFDLERAGTGVRAPARCVRGSPRGLGLLPSRSEHISRMWMCIA